MRAERSDRRRRPSAARGLRRLASPAASGGRASAGALAAGTAAALFGFVCGASAGDVFVDKGACPGEGCSYGERWVAKTTVQLRTHPSRSAAETSALRPGEAVRTISGEVHTTPSRFIVRREHDGFRPGDEVLVYTYLGEGWFRIRHNGELGEADLGFSPWGGSAGRRCERDPRCWGLLEQLLDFEWWVLVRTDSGVEGWVLDSERFEHPVGH